MDLRKTYLVGSSQWHLGHTVELARVVRILAKHIETQLDYEIHYENTFTSLSVATPSFAEHKADITTTLFGPCRNSMFSLTVLVVDARVAPLSTRNAEAHETKRPTRFAE